MTSWILAIMLRIAPLSDDTPTEHARYEDIAQAISETVQEQKPLYTGQWEREHTALDLVSIGFHESEFRRAIDLGYVRGDHGNSCGIWQANQGRGPECERILSSHKYAASVALANARLSFGACRRFGPLAGLRAYASGSCDRGIKVSEKYLGASLWWLHKWAGRMPEEKSK